MRIDRRTLLASALAAPSILTALPAVAQETAWMIMAGQDSGPSGRWGHSLILDTWHNRLLVVGGRDAVGALVDTLWSFDLGVYTWSELIFPAPKLGSEALPPRLRTVPASIISAGNPNMRSSTISGGSTSHPRRGSRSSQAAVRARDLVPRGPSMMRRGSSSPTAVMVVGSMTIPGRSIRARPPGPTSPRPPTNAQWPVPTTIYWRYPDTGSSC